MRKKKIMIQKKNKHYNHFYKFKEINLKTL